MAITPRAARSDYEGTLAAVRATYESEGATFLEFDKQVLGGNYKNHYGKGGTVKVEAIAEAFNLTNVTNYDVLPNGEELVMIRARSR